MIRVFVPAEPSCEFLTGVANSLFTVAEGFRLTSYGPESSDVLLASHFDNTSDVTPRATVVFFDGESCSDYSSERDAPLSAAYSADIYVGPTANHAMLTERGVYCIYVPFASLSFGQRRDDTPLSLVVSRLTPKPPNCQFCAYLAHNIVPSREAFFDALWLEAKKYGKCVVALGSCSGSHGRPVSVKSRFRDGWIDEAVDLLRPYRFAIAFENENVDGYVTEKLVNAYLAGCIPLYSGSIDAFEIFNRDSLLYIDEFDNPIAAAISVMDVVTDDNICSKLLSASPLASGALARFFSWHPSVRGTLGEQIRNAVRNVVARKRYTAGLNGAY